MSGRNSSPLTFEFSDHDREQAETYQLASHCERCFYFLPSHQTCAMGWNTEQQRQWPVATLITFCREFELR